MNEIPDYIQRPTLPLTISIIGCGGTGSMFLTELARVVYAYQVLYRRKVVVTAWDGDTVSGPNVGRQGFNVNEVGLNKAVAIISKINRVYGFDWIAVPQHFPEVKKKDTELFKAVAANIIITAVDKRKPKLEVGKMVDYLTDKKYNIKSKFPEYYSWFWMDLGNTKTTANVIVGSKDMDWPDLRTYLVDQVEPPDTGPSCSLAMALNEQDLFINKQCALIGAKWLWECISQQSIDWRGAFINLDTLIIRKVPTHADTKGDSNSKPQIQRRLKSKHPKRGPRAVKERPAKDRAGSRRRQRSKA